MIPAAGQFRARQTFLPEYIRRAIKLPQMDLEYTFWQMVNLCLDPKRVYKNTSYHKQTKNQWARDDPAFTVLCALFLLVAAIAYTVAFRVTNPWTFLRVVLGAVFFDFVFLGALLATLTWSKANRYLRVLSVPD
ncbi:UNC-50 [Baffinella frigidus]|nr:UNC-50 [Cryptophyta sp. CCMP2293]